MEDAPRNLGLFRHPVDGPLPMTAVSPYPLQERIDVGLHAASISRFSEIGQAEARSEERDRVFPRMGENSLMDQENAHQRSDQRRRAFQRALDGFVASGKFSSLNDWCKKAGVGFNTPSDFLKGLSMSMTDRTYRKLADAAGVTVSYLLGEESLVTEEDRQLIDDLRALDPEERRDLLELLRRRAHAARERRQRGA